MWDIEQELGRKYECFSGLVLRSHSLPTSLLDGCISSVAATINAITGTQNEHQQWSLVSSVPVPP